MTQFDQAYIALIQKIMDYGHLAYNERTGHTTRALPGLTLELNVDREFPLLTLRKIPIQLFVSEMLWYILGNNRPDSFVNEFTSIWKNFTEEDGTVRAAYGHRWRKHFGRDQLGDLVAHLQENPGSRHGVIVTWDPADDGLGTGTHKKNVPCPYTFTVNILGNQLHLHNVIRSNDMMLGCPHDVAGFALLQCILAAKLNVEPGKLTTSISNAHIYDIHYEQAKELINRKHHHPGTPFRALADYFDRAREGDRQLVGEIVESLSQNYHPLERVKGLKIVL